MDSGIILVSSKKEMAMDKQIKVLIVDDYAVVRHGLLALIDTAPDMIVVGEAEDGLTAVKKAQVLNPDVIVMDLVMPGLDGIGAIEAIKQDSPQTCILILTNFGDEYRVLTALRAGAQGYLLKDAVLTDVVEAIRDVHTGKLALHPSITHVLIQSMQVPQKTQGETAVLIDPSLTRREQEVLKLIAKGFANRSLATSLHIDERTVRIHVSNILQKLDLENRTQAALYALSHNLASINDLF